MINREGVIEAISGHKLYNVPGFLKYMGNKCIKRKKITDGTGNCHSFKMETKGTVG